MYVAFRLKFNDSHLLASWRALSAFYSEQS
jgi:hypothetical protein